MLTEHVEINCAPQQVTAEIREVLTAVLEVCRGLPVPVFKEKSAKQQDLDLAHSILNATVEYWLHHVLRWERQVTLSAATEGASDERKSIDFVYKLSNGQVVAIEIQFGNGGRIQADFAKFRTLHAQGKLALGIAVYFKRKTAETADSGLATYEAALQDVRKFGDMPVALVGLSRESTQEVDLRELKGITYAGVLGGSGTNRSVLHQRIARALAEEQPLSSVELDAECRKVIVDQAIDYATKVAFEAQEAYRRALTCTDEDLRLQLLAILAEAAKSTYMPERERVAVVKGAANVTFESELAAKRAKAAAAEARRKARQAEKKAAKKQAEKVARKAERAAEKSAAAPLHSLSPPSVESTTDPADASEPLSGLSVMDAVATSTAVEPATSNMPPAAQEASIAASATAEARASESPAPRRVVRVTKAEDQARQQKAAEASRRTPVRPTVQPPSWNAMGVAFAQALSAADKMK